MKYVIKEAGHVIDRNEHNLSKEKLKDYRNALARRNLPASQSASLYDELEAAEDEDAIREITRQITRAIHAGTLPYISRGE